MRSTPSKCSRRSFILIRTIFLSILINICLIGSSYGLSLDNHLITDDPKEGSGCTTPTAKTAFSPDDAKVYSWVFVSNAFPLNTVAWKWYAPDNSLYATVQTATGFTGAGCAWSWIDIKDQPAASKPGQWKAEIYLNNALAATDTFTIGSAQCTYTYSAWGACQPDGTQSRTVVSSSPAGCTGTPILSQTCAYVPLKFTLTIAKAGAGSGKVTSSPAGITCGGSCSAAFTKGDKVTLSATADSGSKFDGWSGGCTGTGACTVTMNADTTVKAAFSKSTLNPPLNLKFTLNDSKLTVDWNTAVGAKGYKAGLGNSSGAYALSADLGNTNRVGPFDVSGISGTYYLAVKAYNDTEESAYSNEIVIALITGAGAAQLDFSLNDQVLAPWGYAHLSYRIKSFKPGLQADLYLASQVDSGGSLIPPDKIFSFTAMALATDLSLSDTQQVIFAGNLPAQMSPLILKLYGVLVAHGMSPANPANWISNLATLDAALGPLSSSQLEVITKQGNPQAYIVDFDRDKQQRLETWIYQQGDLGHTFQFMNGSVVGTRQEGERNCCSKGGSPTRYSPGTFTPATTVQDVRELLGDPDHVVKGSAAGRETWVFDGPKITVVFENGLIRRIEEY